MTLEVVDSDAPPPLGWDIPAPINVRAYLERRRTALLDEVRAIEDALSIEPKVRAICPQCQTRWNKKKAG